MVVIKPRNLSSLPYLLGLHWIHNGSLLGFFIDDEVHVVVRQRWKNLHLHVGLRDHLGRPSLKFGMEEAGPKLWQTLGEK